jgi:VanZ family protein
MSKSFQIFLRWLPALIMMIVIFFFSAQSASRLPEFGGADRFIKKSGHVIGYAILAFLYWRALEFSEEKRRVAWLLALLYAMTDEYHQSFVSGRHSTIWDVILFDNLGTLISLWFVARSRKQKRPDPFHPIVR